MFKSTFGISKKKLVENYERQINNKNSDIHKLVKEVKYLEQELKSNEEKYNEDIQKISSERDIYKNNLEQVKVEKGLIIKDNMGLNKRINELEKDKEYLRKENIEYHDLYLKESNKSYRANEINDKLTTKLIEKERRLSKLIERNFILDEMTDELTNEIDKLVDKKINRLEAIKKRTKRLRIKKKCEAKILELEKRYLD